MSTQLSVHRVPWTLAAQYWRGFARFTSNVQRPRLPDIYIYILNLTYRHPPPKIEKYLKNWGKGENNKGVFLPYLEVDVGRKDETQ